MAKKTKLSPWQKEITKEEWLKELTAGNSRGVGFSSAVNKYYRTDSANAEYIKYVAAKKQKKKDKLTRIKTRVAEIAFKKGARQGVKDFLKSDKFKKKLAAEFKKGAKSAKPKVNKQERIAKQEAKLEEKLKSLKAAKAKLTK